MRLAVLFVLSLISLHVQGQIYNPVTWSTSHEKLDDNTYQLIFTANIEEGWNMYSQYLESDDGPVRTSFHYDEAEGFSLVGKNEESGKIKEGYDEMFGMNVIKLQGEITFTQKVTLSAMPTTITGYVEYMVCDDERCLPPTEQEFSFTLGNKGQGAAPSPDKNKPGEAAEQSASSEEQEALVADAGQEGKNQSATEELTAPQEPATDVKIKNPVQWSATLVPLDADRQYELRWTAEVAAGWNIYSSYTDENGPIPTSFTYEGDTAHYTLQGELREDGKLKSERDPLFNNVEVKKFSAGEVQFTQRIKVKDAQQPIRGFLEYMACDATSCLPPEMVDFYFLPAEKKALLGAAAQSAAAAPIADTQSSQTDLYTMPRPDLEDPVGTCGASTQAIRSGSSTFTIFGLGFLGGLLALLTPCVFPMIPLTVSFFTKSSGNRARGIRDASLYGLFILGVYLILSVPFHLMDSINPDILNDISTNVWLNVFFFAIFLFFAFSFFGYYELTLPSKWTNKASSAESIGGIVGIFFMALTLALVSFSCTGPILGSLLAGALSNDGAATQLTAGMGGFGMALALPFTLFAAFPQIMNRLPKSGEWLNSVKVVLGFLELALALKFLSNADLVQHWEFLKIELFLGLWILIFAAMGLYLFGVLKFPHDSPIKKLSPVRIGLGIASFAFVAYLASGFIVDQDKGTYRSLSLLSGLAPPVTYSYFYPGDCPQGFDCYKDLDAGLAYAKKENKPVLLDFTGYACVNCRKMEEHVWPEKQVADLIGKDYVLISLYVDDKKALPESEQQTVPQVGGDGSRRLRTVGNKWSYFQTVYFRANTQPYYALLSPDGQLLNTPVGYTPDSDKFADFLRCGKDAYRQMAERK